MGHHEPGIGALSAELQLGDEVPFAVPRVGDVAEFVKTALLDAGLGEGDFEAVLCL
jgi:hypothetical protein